MKIHYLILAALLGIVEPMLAMAKASEDDVAKEFVDPPPGTGPIFYWGWFGPAVTKAGIDRDLQNMHQAHGSGVVVMPYYPVALDAPDKNIRNLSLLSAEFLDLLRHAALRAKELGLTFTVIPGSGWPYGGPWIASELGARKLVFQREGQVGPGETVAKFDGASAIAVPTGMQVKRPAVGGEGLVLDPLNSAALQAHLDAVGRPFAKALQDTGWRGILLDSLEVYDANWTGDFLQEFHKQHGYELTPHLPLLFNAANRDGLQHRRRFWTTVASLTEQRHFAPLQRWCREREIELMAEPYGVPCVSLRVFRYVDRPTGEHYQWKCFNATRWAAAGAQLHGRNIVTAEAWTNLGMTPEGINRFADSLADFKLASDMHFLSGANQLFPTCYAYTAPEAGHPGWVPYHGTVINHQQPWWPYFHLLGRYIQRCSYALQLGRGATQVGVYLPSGDLYAKTPANAQAPHGGLISHMAMRDHLHGRGIIEFGLHSARQEETPLISTLACGGWSSGLLDDATLPDARVEAGKLCMGTAEFSVIVLPNVHGLPLGDLQQLARFVEAGGVLIATRRLPDIAYARSDAEDDTRALRELVKKLFADKPYGRGRAILVADERTAFHKALVDNAPPFVQPATLDLDVGFVHRDLGEEDLIFVVNTSDRVKTLSLAFRNGRQPTQVWDSLTGDVATGWDGVVHLEPRGSRFLRIGPARHQPDLPPRAVPQPVARIELSEAWTLHVPGRDAVAQSKLQPWTTIDALQHFSGAGRYDTTLSLPDDLGERRVVLDLGAVHEIAEVAVNGKPAGVVWMPGRRLDVTTHVRPGKNSLSVKVTNLWINEMLGAPKPDYSALVRRYGDRFPSPREWDIAKPLVSGLSGPVVYEMYEATSGPDKATPERPR